jgi:hypothetical protein
MHLAIDSFPDDKFEAHGIHYDLTTLTMHLRTMVIYVNRTRKQSYYEYIATMKDGWRFELTFSTDRDISFQGILAN